MKRMALLVALAACTRTAPVVDLVPPRVVAVSPGTRNVPVDATIDIEFSKPLAMDRVFWSDPTTGDEVADSVLLGRAEDEDALVGAASHPPLSDSERAKVVPATVTASDDHTRLDVVPVQPLDGDGDYVLVLSKRITDEHRNALVGDVGGENETVVIELSTAPAPPVASLDVPVAGAVGVPLDLASLRVRFSRTIDLATVTNSRLGLVDLTAGASVEPARVTWMGELATLELPPDAAAGCATLCAGHEYALFVDASVTDGDGQGVVPVDAKRECFTAATCLREEPPRLASASIAVAPTDRSAVVSWNTDEPSSSRVVYAEGGPDALATCLANGGCAEARGDDATCWVDPCHPPADEASFTCRHAVRLPSLGASTSYAFEVESADAAGRASRSGATGFTTIPPLPKLVLTELFASPEGFVDPNEGKFVELLNADAAPIDLTPKGEGASREAWALARCVEPTCTHGFANRWPMRPAGDGVLAPGAYALAVGEAFDPMRMGVPFGTMLLGSDTGSKTVLSNGLSKGAAATFALLAPGDVVVSTYSAWLGRPDANASDGKSFERVDAAGEDVAANWARSTAALSGAPGDFATPGRPNSSSP